MECECDFLLPLEVFIDLHHYFSFKSFQRFLENVTNAPLDGSYKIKQM